MSPKDLSVFFFSSLDVLAQVLHELAALKLQQSDFFIRVANAD